MFTSTSYTSLQPSLHPDDEWTEQSIQAFIQYANCPPGDAESPEQVQQTLPSVRQLSWRGNFSAILCSLTLILLVSAYIGLAPSLLRGAGSDKVPLAPAPATASIMVAADAVSNIGVTSSSSTTHSSTTSKTTLTPVRCNTPDDDDPCRGSMLWVQAQLSSGGVHVSRSQSESFLEDIQQKLFDRDLGGCHNRPCPLSEHLPYLQVKPDCVTAAWPSPCYDEVQKTFYNIKSHPDKYAGFDPSSTFMEVQQYLYVRGRPACQLPCPEILDPSILLFRPPSSGLAEAQLCAKDASLPEHYETSLVTSNEQEESECYSKLDSIGVAHGGRDSGRKWCWVALKFYGCVVNWNQHLTWNSMFSYGRTKGIHRPESFHPLARSDMCDAGTLGGRVEWTANEWHEAKAWFHQVVAVYVLSLPSATGRRALSSKCMRKAQIEFEFVDGVDMREPQALGNAKMEGLVPKSYDLQAAQEEAYREGMGEFGSIKGTLGCLTGHLRAQRRGMLDKHKRKLSLVFEDDICPSEDFIPRLWRLVTAELPCDWQVLKLQSHCPFGTCVSPHLIRVQPDLNELASRCRHGVNYAMYGVLYRIDAVESLQRELMPIVFNEMQPACLDVDVAMASISDKYAYYAVPASQQPGFLREMLGGSTRIEINGKKNWKR